MEVVVHSSGLATWRSTQHEMEKQEAARMGGAAGLADKEDLEPDAERAGGGGGDGRIHAGGELL